ncbi:grpE protein homolog 1, mitochondrial-like isoform X2 [Ylistrum balloti]|uniref:grpE protein homolog 1, mitochondrial-like isoform X2 n=1 Tax=Ylistrum balloti TaxID=509963 RepID=UPI002905F407|nr:grpE protein homolog 1, mitochondrial-like isoform X2 [Ylistrum balloti]
MATMGSMCLRSANRMANITRSYILRTQHMRSNLRQCTTTTTEKNNNTTEPPGSKMDKSAEKPETKQDEKTSAASEAEATLKKEKEKLEDTVKDMKDKYIRALAETENVRQRMKKQVDDAKIFGIQGFCKDLLEVADILGKATESVPKEEVKDENIHLKNLFQGLTMTESQLLKVFNKHGLEQITPAEGEKFDPFIHEAMFEVPTANQEAASTIAVTTKVGYKLSDRTIRPALVGVFKAT